MLYPFRAPAACYAGDKLAWERPSKLDVHVLVFVALAVTKTNFIIAVSPSCVRRRQRRRNGKREHRDEGDGQCCGCCVLVHWSPP
jgi:hypothetical protein